MACGRSVPMASAPTFPARVRPLPAPIPDHIPEPTLTPSSSCVLYPRLRSSCPLPLELFLPSPVWLPSSYMSSSDPYEHLETAELYIHTVCVVGQGWSEVLQVALSQWHDAPLMLPCLPRHPGGDRSVHGVVSDLQYHIFGDGDEDLVPRA